jgi:hypothetical protein
LAVCDGISIDLGVKIGISDSGCVNPWRLGLTQLADMEQGFLLEEFYVTPDFF